MSADQPSLFQAAAPRGRRSARPSAEPFLPEDRSLDALARAAADCRGCPLWEPATQTVFGAGGPHAPLMLVGEQPGDVEDQQGLPFVGPAGAVLRRALERAGVAVGDVYLTNAVKHFKFERASNGRRLHKNPGTTEITACRPWLSAELDAVPARVVVALGAVAARALFGPGVRVSEPQPPFPWQDRTAVATVHPSAVLRSPDERRDALFDRLVGDLRAAAEVAGRS